MTKTATKKSTPATTASDDSSFEKLPNFLSLDLIIFILRKLSSEKNPLRVGEIKTYLYNLTDQEYSEKHIGEKLNYLSQLQEKCLDSEEDNSLYDILMQIWGGEIIATGTDSNNKYYFQPLMDTSDVSMICGSIASNRYLTAAEKKYLISREQLLTYFKNDVVKLENIQRLQESEYIQQLIDEKDAHFLSKQKYKKNIKNQLHIKTLDKTTDPLLEITNYSYTFPSVPLPPKPFVRHRKDSPEVNYLDHVNKLHDAIEQEYAIEILCGNYDLDTDDSGKIKLQYRNKRPYVINPYALLWNNGFYYLLATHAGHDNIAHFRVDRILAIKELPDKKDARIPAKRAAIPESLQPFFETNEDGAQVFLPEKYTATYPLMTYHQKDNLITCSLECTAQTLSILIDTFGKDLKIKESALDHSAEKTDKGNPQKFYSVEIPNVQYDNIVQFCLHHHTMVTALRPEKLVNDVAKGFAAAFQRYQNVQNQLYEK